MEKKEEEEKWWNGMSIPVGQSVVNGFDIEWKEKEKRKKTSNGKHGGAVDTVELSSYPYRGVS